MRNLKLYQEIEKYTDIKCLCIYSNQAHEKAKYYLKKAQQNKVWYKRLLSFTYPYNFKYYYDLFKIFRKGEFRHLNIDKNYLAALIMSSKENK